YSPSNKFLEETIQTRALLTQTKVALQIMFELFFFEIIFRDLKRAGKNKECVNPVLEFFSFICDADFLLNFDLFLPCCLIASMSMSSPAK
ncbi:hypothetical protein, partial [Parasutterella excrementihominis]|uniref:hypothetical protein n=1 Tax=Parasutterella excrementihominis TaxID=487175 RepID=UPI00241FC500